MLRTIFSNFWQNVAACFTKRNILLQLLGAALTYILVTSGFDWWYFESTRGTIIPYVAYAAGIVGFFLPVVLPLGLYIFGDLTHKNHVARAGVAVAQAGIVAISLSSLYKAFTGRAHPDLFSAGKGIDVTHQFHFGFFREGVFWGWPSSHTTVAFATMLAFAYMYPRNKTLFFVCVAYALFIGIGVSVSFHWFSDFVAGAILGSVIGSTIGKSFEHATGVQTR